MLAAAAEPSYIKQVKPRRRNRIRVTNCITFYSSSDLAYKSFDFINCWKGRDSSILCYG